DGFRFVLELPVSVSAKVPFRGSLGERRQKRGRGRWIHQVSSLPEHGQPAACDPMLIHWSSVAACLKQLGDAAPKARYIGFGTSLNSGILGKKRRKSADGSFLPVCIWRARLDNINRSCAALYPCQSTCVCTTERAK